MSVGLIRIITTPNFQASIDTVGTNELLLKFSGKLNEDINFGVIVKHLQSDFKGRNQLAFDVSELGTINSAGAREWLLFLERIQLSFNIRFENISEAFVSNAIITPNFLGRTGTPVRLFAIPYYCGKCDVRSEVVVNSENFPVGKPFVAPSRKCEKCGGALDFDAIESEYGVFLEHAHASR